MVLIVRPATGRLEEWLSFPSAAWSRHVPTGTTAAAGRKDQLVRRKENQQLGEEGLQMLLEVLKLLGVAAEEGPQLLAVEGKGRTQNRGRLMTESRTGC
jgi:hypothetical protein